MSDQEGILDEEEVAGWWSQCQFQIVDTSWMDRRETEERNHKNGFRRVENSRNAGRSEHRPVEEAAVRIAIGSGLIARRGVARVVAVGIFRRTCVVELRRSGLDASGRAQRGAKTRLEGEDRGNRQNEARAAPRAEICTGSHSPYLRCPVPDPIDPDGSKPQGGSPLAQFRCPVAWLIGSVSRRLEAPFYRLPPVGRPAARPLASRAPAARDRLPTAPRRGIRGRTVWLRDMDSVRLRRIRIPSKTAAEFAAGRPPARLRSPLVTSGPDRAPRRTRSHCPSMLSEVWEEPASHRAPRPLAPAVRWRLRGSPARI